MWKQQLIETTRGIFEVFRKGHGAPLCVTHHYSIFNTSGDYFADTFAAHNEVFLINLRECGCSEKAHQPFELSLLETVFDLESIRAALGFEQWGFAGHSTGGMIGLVYGIYFSKSLNYNVIVGSAARDYMTFSKNCIYNQGHVHFDQMQQLLQMLKRHDLSNEDKEALKIERTKLSLFKPEQYELYFDKPIQKGLSAARLNYFDREVQLFDVTRKLPFTTAPTLIICGQHDVQCPVEYSMELNVLIPNSTLRIMNESNHYPFLEEKTLFEEEYLKFVAQVLN